jgi:Fe-S oxidoreductase/nitrate reductase gamma subunit
VPGWFHSFIFYSFLVLVLTTTVVGFDEDLGTHLFRGYTYAFLTVGSEVGGLLLMVGAGMAAARRFVSRPRTLPSTLGDGGALLLLSGLALTGFLVEGLRIAAIGDRWASLSPVGWAASKLFTGLSTAGASRVHAWLWWFHAALAMGFIAAIPHTKFFHLVSLPTNLFFSRLRPRGELKRVDVEAVMTADDFDEANFTLGVARAGDFTWKQRLDFDACISCGRCDEVCPSYQAGEPFSPKQFVHAGRDLVARAARAAHAAAGGEDGADLLVGNELTEDFIWYCRTCSACMEVCPAAIDHVDSMVDVRRNELMVQGRVPPEASRMLKLLESQGNPFGKRQLRMQWIREMKVPVVPPGGDVDVLYWIGCLTTFDATKQKIAADLFQLMDRAGISYGVLGADETCCGDPARLLGDERLFQDIARSQAAAITSRTFRTLLVSCPHCMTVLRDEYAQFGAKLEVTHHSELLRQLLDRGVLQAAGRKEEKVVFHDPCYLGRYQRAFDGPRKVVEAIPGIDAAEMASCGERSLCCGGGGGHYWMDLKVEGAERPSSRRVAQAEEAGARTIVTGCPYCHQMLQDGVKLRNLDKRLKVVDLATLLLDSVGRQADPAKQA